MRLDGVGDAGSGVPWAFLPQQVDVEPDQAFAGWINERLRAARDTRRLGPVQAGVLSVQVPVPVTGAVSRPDDGGEPA